MGQPVVLPKFELSGDRPHWAVRAAWITGGLLLVSVLALGAVIVHHRNLETQAQLAKVEAIARVKAEAEAKVAAVAAAAKVQKEAELAAKLAAQGLPADTLVGAASTGDSGTSDRAGKASQARRAHASRSGKSFRSAKTAGKSPSKSASSKPDAIDELLRKMK